MPQANRTFYTAPRLLASFGTRSNVVSSRPRAGPISDYPRGRGRRVARNAAGRGAVGNFRRHAVWRGGGRHAVARRVARPAAGPEPTPRPFHGLGAGAL